MCVVGMLWLCVVVWLCGRGAVDVCGGVVTVCVIG